MKQWLTDLFSNSEKVSMIRVLSFISVITASAIALRAVEKGIDLNAVSVLCGVFLGAGIGGKVAQKVQEVKNGNRE